jgi:hypothetical protein
MRKLSVTEIRLNWENASKLSSTWRETRLTSIDPSIKLLQQLRNPVLCPAGSVLSNVPPVLLRYSTPENELVLL